MPDGDMHIEDFSICDYCWNRFDCYDENMVVSLCSSFSRDDSTYNDLLKHIANMNGNDPARYEFRIDFDKDKK